MKLWERLEHVRQAAGWSAREFSRRAGLRTETHYTQLLKRMRDGRPAEFPTLQALGDAASQAGFNPTWVLQGTGAQKVHTSSAPPQKRNMTPTPAPLSTVRTGTAHAALVVPRLPNRERAAELLIARGYDATRIDEELAMVTFDALLSPFEDRPVTWWIDAIRERLQSSAR